MEKRTMYSLAAGIAGAAGVAWLFSPGGSSLRKMVSGSVSRLGSMLRFVIAGDTEDVKEVATAPVETATGREPLPGEISQANPRTINAKHLNTNPVQQRVHKNKNALPK